MDISCTRKITNTLWEIPAYGDMRVPARIYASEKMLPKIFADNAPQQAVNVAHLPGIIEASLAMPDIHWGYGFPIGGVVVFMMRSKTKSGMSAGVQIVDQTPFAPPQIPADPVVHPPCKDCGGFLQEMTHDGNRWTWCPSCRAWQDYLGKA